VRSIVDREYELTLDFKRVEAKALGQNSG